MDESSIHLKSINDLLKFNFIIPSYQRGYRWTETQVVDLLNDIYEFIQKKEDKVDSVGDFYCLQPIIVKSTEGNNWRLIDGQQRLTTIFIILSFLNKKRFTIEFETRIKSKGFLENLSDKINKDNIDFYHISKAYNHIKKWFDGKEEDEATIADEFYINLGKYTKVIWYEIDQNDDEIEVFTRINSGKIPLTNAELIKALFLNSKNFDSDEKNLKQIEIAKEWDEMESTLQKDKIWHFLNKQNDYPTRIEILFQVLSNNQNEDEFSTYRFFSKKQNIVELWSESDESVKKVFLSIKHWYDHNKLFHLIGFLIATNQNNVKEIYSDFIGKGKKEFESFLIKKVLRNIDTDKIEELEYTNHSTEIMRALLLFNIGTILQSNDSYVRFAFDKFNQEKWSLEHIHAQQDKGLNSKASILNWLKDAKAQIKLLEGLSKEQKNQKNEIILESKKIELKDKITSDDEDFRTLENKIFDFFGEADIHTIDNLALLSNQVNSSLSNSIFPIKRNILINKDKIGEFIPICTKNVFLKYYSTNVQNLYFWNTDDRKSYLNEIKSVLKAI
tara:strand:+ start:25910 stop:27583 length:1674 start_codon:yes stop_codon:yes gene_type:complete